MTPQSLTQGFLQNNSGLQTTAQSNLPVVPNNGNPMTIYNQTPRGGFLPPVSNAYDEWRINPTPTYGSVPMGFLSGTGDFPRPYINLGGGGAGGTIPVLPGGGTTPTTPTTPAPTQGPAGPANPAVSFPIGSGGWMLGGPTAPVSPGINYAGMNTGYTSPGFGMGISGTGFNGMRTGGTTGGGSFPNINLNNTFGNILDALLPGDAIQNGSVNWQNLGLGVVDQYTGLPVTWGLDRLANTDWAQTSDSRFAQWLRDWNFTNDDAAMQQYYRENGITGAPTGWLSGAFDYLNTPQQAVTDAAGNVTSTARDAWATLAAAMAGAATSPVDIYRREGAAGLMSRTNPRTGRPYTPLEINAISQQASGSGMGIGNAAAGAMGSRFADVLQGDAARDAFRGMYMAQLMTPTMQVHDREN